MNPRNAIRGFLVGESIPPNNREWVTQGAPPFFSLIGPLQTYSYTTPSNPPAHAKERVHDAHAHTSSAPLGERLHGECRRDHLTA